MRRQQRGGAGRGCEPVHQPARRAAVPAEEPRESPRIVEEVSVDQIKRRTDKQSARCAVHVRQLASNNNNRGTHERSNSSHPSAGYPRSTTHWFVSCRGGHAEHGNCRRAGQRRNRRIRDRLCPLCRGLCFNRVRRCPCHAIAVAFQCLPRSAAPCWFAPLPPLRRSTRARPGKLPASAPPKDPPSPTVAPIRCAAPPAARRKALPAERCPERSVVLSLARLVPQPVRPQEHRKAPQPVPRRARAPRPASA